MQIFFKMVKLLFAIIANLITLCCCFNQFNLDFEPEENRPYVVDRWNYERWPKFRKVFLEQINFHRSEHSVPNLTEDPQASSEGDITAEQLRVDHNKTLIERGDKINGRHLYETLRVRIGYAGNWTELAITAVREWHSEICLYDPKISDQQDAAAHYTQLVWKGSTKIGIAIASNMNRSHVLILAQYAPTGNDINKFKENFPLSGYCKNVKSYCNKTIDNCESLGNAVDRSGNCLVTFIIIILVGLFLTHDDPLTLRV